MVMSKFCKTHHPQNLLKNPTRNKSSSQPTFIKLILTYFPTLFQHTETIETRLKPNISNYRYYTGFINDYF